jgi:hypothetical protein
MVGPVGIERLMLLKPEALHQILTKDWLQYPRVSVLSTANEDVKYLTGTSRLGFSVPSLAYSLGKDCLPLPATNIDKYEKQ